MVNITFYNYEGNDKDALCGRCKISFDFEISLTSDGSKVLGRSSIAPFDLSGTTNEYDINSLINFPIDKFGVKLY